MTEDRKIVSIDVFDTAIFRSVYNPKDVFKVIENRVHKNFYECRVEAQKKAGLKNANYSLVDIYSYMPSYFDLKEEIIEEIKGARPNKYILDFYNANRNKYDFVFISDMYLPSKVIKALLEHAGYVNPKVFVSCEEKCMKCDGRLFLRVQEKLGRKIYKHIGDNYNIDIKGAKLARIPNVEFIGPPIYMRDVETPELKNPLLRKLLIDNEFNEETDMAYKIGYMFSPLVLLFTQEVLKKATDNNTIYFNARDSFLMYLIARWVLKTKKKIKYCRFSRKSVHFPYININYNITDERNKKPFNFLAMARVNSLKDFVASFKIDFPADIKELLLKYHITEDTDLLLRSDRTQILREFIVLAKKEIYKKALHERKNFIQYIKKLGMKSGDIFVDLGHFGSMQSIIQGITGIKLQGEYIHLFENYDKPFEDKAIKNSLLPHGFIKFFTGIVEVVMTEPKGTVIGYNEKGTPVITTDIKYRKRVTKRIIRGVIQGAKDIVNNKIDVCLEDCMNILKRFLEYPTLEEASFANDKIFENGSLFANESVVWYNREMIKQGKIKDCYNKSYWKPAFRVLLLNDPDYKFLLGELR